MEALPDLLEALFYLGLAIAHFIRAFSGTD
jgi:hypothetical protein